MLSCNLSLVRVAGKETYNTLEKNAQNRRFSVTNTFMTFSGTASAKKFKFFSRLDTEKY